MIGRVLTRLTKSPSLPCAYRFPATAVAFPRSEFSTTVDNGGQEETSIEDIARRIDTTLTEEQKAYVAKIKKQIRGGPNAPRSLHREVPLPHEVVGLGNFVPRIADNAEALIDYALSHIPPRAGPRRSRQKKRMERKHEAKREFDAQKKKEIAAANERKQAKRLRIRREVQEVRAEAARLAEIKRMKAEVRRARSASQASAGSSA